jgi:hypothetical protein
MASVQQKRRVMGGVSIRPTDDSLRFNVMFGILMLEQPDGVNIYMYRDPKFHMI